MATLHEDLFEIVWYRLFGIPWRVAKNIPPHVFFFTFYADKIEAQKLCDFAARNVIYSIRQVQDWENEGGYYVD